MGKYQEVFIVKPEFKKISKKRKLAVLSLLIKWAGEEMIKITSDKK